MKDKNSREHGIDKYHQLDTNDDLAGQLNAVYSDWADSYDHDNDHKLKTISQPNTVAMLARHCPDKHARIIDVGCGTGIVGHYLKEHEFTCFDGTDPSQAMIEHAKNRGYSNLFLLRPGEPLPIPDSDYDVALCVGVFTHGHLGPEGMDELLRVTKAGGLICFTINEGVWETQGFPEAIEHHVIHNDWEILEVSKQDYMVNEGVQAWYIAARKV